MVVCCVGVNLSSSKVSPFARKLRSMKTKLLNLNVLFPILQASGAVRLMAASQLNQWCRGKNRIWPFWNAPKYDKSLSVVNKPEMGIQGLLPLLKKIQKPVSIADDFAGQVIGVDTYCWLHKGAYGCAMELVEGKKSFMYVAPIFTLQRKNVCCVCHCRWEGGGGIGGRRKLFTSYFSHLPAFTPVFLPLLQ